MLGWLSWQSWTAVNISKCFLSILYLSLMDQLVTYQSEHHLNSAGLGNWSLSFQIITMFSHTATLDDSLRTTTLSTEPEGTNRVVNSRTARREKEWAGEGGACGQIAMAVAPHWNPSKPCFSGVPCTVSFEKRVPLLKTQIENHSFSTLYFKDEMGPNRL